MLIKTGRQQNGLTQGELAKKFGVSQATVSNWEAGKQIPDSGQVEKLQTILGLSLGASQADAGRAEIPSSIGVWLSREREKAEFTISELASKAGVSLPTIYSIESGKARNPRQRTIRLLEEALGKRLDPEYQRELEQSGRIEGLGNFADFNPHDDKEWPDEAGVYVFYDIADRPIYVGQGKSIAVRIKDHQEKFWFKRPIVERASYIPVAEERLRKQIESLLIKFLKSNAVLNKQQVDRAN